MASAGRGGDRPGYVRRVIRIPRAVVRVPGQHNITISLQPLRAQGQGQYLSLKLSWVIMSIYMLQEGS